MLPVNIRGPLENDSCPVSFDSEVIYGTIYNFVNLFYFNFSSYSSDKSNERVRDTILLKKLKTSLRESTTETGKIKSSNFCFVFILNLEHVFIWKGSLWEDLELFLKEIKTPFIKQQVFIFSNKIDLSFMERFNFF